MYWKGRKNKGREILRTILWEVNTLEPSKSNHLNQNRKKLLLQITGTNIKAGDGQNRGKMEYWGNSNTISKEATMDVWG